MSIIFCLTDVPSETLTVNPEVLNQPVAAVLGLAHSMFDETLESFGYDYSVVLAEWPGRFWSFSTTMTSIMKTTACAPEAA